MLKMNDMAYGLSARRDTDRARSGIKPTARVLGRKQSHYGVGIDIGSGTDPAGVYDDLSRAPFPRFNEKSFCALGASTGQQRLRLRREAIDAAIYAIRRFHAMLSPGDGCHDRSMSSRLKLQAGRRTDRAGRCHS
ncbi:MAG: hypothetical protein R3F53_19470 [Gammaproteobacteria bacterium]